MNKLNKMKEQDLFRYIEGQTSMTENEAIVQWLDRSPDNMQEYLLLRYIYDSTLWIDESVNVFSSSGDNSFDKRKKKRLIIFKSLAKYAAVFIFGIVIYHFSGLQEENKNHFSLKKVISPQGQRTELDLSDGTKVWLNANSSITFPDNFPDTARVVILDGEAYFDVAHNPQCRFVVQTSNYQVNVYGTEFDVIDYNTGDFFETSLINGSVEISSRLNHNKMMLTPNQKFLSQDGVSRIEPINDADQFLWKDGIISFNNNDVSEIFVKLEHYYDVKIDVKNKKILTNRYTGKFRMKDGVEHILKVLQLGNDFKYTISSRDINIL